MSNPLPSVVAVARINGDVLPGTIFTPASKQDLADLMALDAVREPTEAETALAEKRAAKQAGAPAPAKRKTKAEKEAEAAAAAEADATAAAEADATAAAEAEAAAATDATAAAATDATADATTEAVTADADVIG